MLLIIKNYTGDILNFEMAKELPAMDEIDVEEVVVDDDIAVEKQHVYGREAWRSGDYSVHKILGDAKKWGELDSTEGIRRASGCRYQNKLVSHYGP